MDMVVGGHEGPCRDLLIEDLHEGQGYSFLERITDREMTEFHRLSGDNNPLHQEDGFAQKRGFVSRVVYGLLLASYVSRMIGRFLPGRNCLLLGIELKFLSPCYVGDVIEVTAVVDKISVAVKAAVLKIVIRNKDSQTVLARGKATVGVTREVNRGKDA